MVRIVIEHFEPPADNEATIVCDPGHSLEEWIARIVSAVNAHVPAPETLP